MKVIAQIKTDDGDTREITLDETLATFKRLVQADDPETAIADLLGDLMHLLRDQAVDFDAALERAHKYFVEER